MRRTTLGSSCLSAVQELVGFRAWGLAAWKLLGLGDREFRVCGEFSVDGNQRFWVKGSGSRAWV